MDGCVPIAGLLILILILAGVGHLIWIILAAIGRALFGGAQPPTSPHATAEQALYRLYHSGRIDERTLDTVLRAIRDEARPGQVASPLMPSRPFEPGRTSDDETRIEPANLPAASPEPKLFKELPDVSATAEVPLNVVPMPVIAFPPSHPPTLPPAEPQRPWTEVLASFMKEANIRWGELVGGLLIIGCSIALVRTFWSSIADHTWLKLSVFTAITAAVFGIGLYTEHRWKLPTTSRAILIIASLMVPLTFFAVLLRATGVLGAPALAGIILALALLGYLLWVSGRVLTAEYPLALVVGVLGPSAAQIALSYLSSDTTLLLLINASIPLAFYVAANVRSGLVVSREPTLEEPLVDRLLILLGITTFAIFPAVSRLVPMDNAQPVLRTLSMLFPLAAVPALLVGILLWSRLTSPAMLNRRLVGAAIALLGVTLLVAAVFLAYPQPHAAIYCGIYALAAFAIAYIDERSEVTWVAAALLLISIFLWPEISLVRDGGAIGLIYAGVCMLGSIASKFRERARHVFTKPLTTLALIVSIAAIGHTFGRIAPEMGLPSITRWQIATYLLAATGIWFAASISLGQAAIFTAFQVLLAASAIAIAWAISGAVIPSLAALRDATLGISVLMLADAGIRRLHSKLPIKLQRPDQAIDLNPFFQASVLASLAILAFVVVKPGLVAEFSSESLTPPASPLLTVWTWIIPLLLVAALLISRESRPALVTDAALVLTLLLALPLGAAYLAGSSATASAWRWLSVAVMLVLSIPTWLRSSRPVLQTKPLYLWLTLIPILTLSIYPAVLTLSGESFVGPASGSLFAGLGSSGNYVPPLVLSVAILATHAIIDHSPKLALAAGLVLNLSISLAYALHITTSGQAFVDHHLVRLLQFNALATAGFAGAWLLILRRRPEQPAWPLVVELAVAVIPLLILLAFAEVRLIADAADSITASREIWASRIADVVGIPATLGLAFVALWAERRISQKTSTLSIVLLMMLLGTLIAFTAWSYGNWVGIHALIASRIVAAWVILQLGWLAGRSLALPDIASPDTVADGAVARMLGWKRVGSNITIVTAVLGALAIVLGLLTMRSDPSRGAWTVAAVLSGAALATALSIWTLRSGVLFAMGILLVAAATIWWEYQSPRGSALELIYLNTLALSVGGLVSIGVELLILRPHRGDAVRRMQFSWHVLACVLATLALAGVTLLTFVTIPIFGAGIVHPALLWSSLAATSLLALLCLYDEDAWCVMPSLYVLGLAWIGQSYGLLRPLITVHLWHAIAALGGYSVLVALIYNLRGNLVAHLPALGIPRRDYWPSGSPQWLSGTTLAIAVIVGILAVPYVLFDPSRSERQATAGAAVCMAVAIGLLGAEKGRRTLKTAALISGAAAVVLWGLAWISPRQPDTLLNRLVVSMVALSALTVMCAIASSRWLKPESEWSRSSRSLTPFLGVMTAIMLAAVMGFELKEYQPDPPVPIMAAPAFFTVALALAALAIGSFLCAFRPSLDPLRLPERPRTAYVYAAQILIGLIAAHIRLIHPEWFGNGFFARYWPIILLVTALVNAGVSEWLRRRNMLILAEPFTNIGTVLPFTLVGGFALPDTSRALIDLSFALLLIGGLYAALAVTRRSMVFSTLAILAANGALWQRLHTIPGFAFLEHPQLWLIPPALSVLGAAYFNRHRLSREQTSTIRYVCLIVIYLSSTADVWINLQRTPWLAFVLAALAAAGVFVGIAARIQSFLFMGCAFAFVAVVAMIRIAAQQVHANWPWLVSGILFGAMIVITFALFEKKRAQMLGMLEKLKDWEK